ncbi:MAG: cobalamin biosynthesis protein [Nitrospirota bacterium]|nr:cobalamin biosynthesis protein [Nitrospirota bacterium]
MEMAMTTQKKLWIGLSILVILTPIGLILPELLGAGGAWGEWGADELEKMLGYLPEGMRQTIDRWRAPMPDYATGEHGMGRLSAEYILSAIIGVGLCAGAVFLLMKLLGKKERDDS